MYDIKIINARVFDFDTEKDSITDIGIEDGKIISIKNTEGSGKIEIDAGGKVVSPGFVDIHMHEEVIGEGVCDDYDIANNMLLMGVTTCVAGCCGNNRQNIKDFFEFIDNNGAPVNYLSFVGHNFLREQVGISDRYREATKDELRQMKTLVYRNIVEQEAIGISFGLEYSPGVSLEEVISLCQAVQSEDIILSAHFRKDAEYGIDSIKEMIEISRLTAKPLHISHIGSCIAYGMMDEALDVVQKAIDKGIDVGADCYPYNAFSTFIGSAVFDEGCFKLWNKSYDSILLTEEPYKGQFCDKELFHLVRSKYPDMLVVAFVMDEEEVLKAIKAPFVSIASDGLFKKGQGHPRGAGTFPRVLGRFVREKGELSLIDALKKMTVMPAKRLGLADKGDIKEGMDADIVIFDPDTIIDKATFEKPTLPPHGISYVIINGELAVKNNKILKNRLGKVIRKSQLKERGIYND